MRRTLARIATAAFLGLALSACTTGPATHRSSAPAFDANGNTAPALKP